MAVRARRLFGPVEVPSSTITLYLVPAGRTAIVRTLLVYNPSLTVTAFGLLAVSFSGGDILMWQTEPLPPGQAESFPGDITLNPGEALVGGSSSSTVDVIMVGMGTLLQGAPE